MAEAGVGDPRRRRDGVPRLGSHRHPGQPTVPRRDDVRRLGQSRPRRLDPHHPPGDRRGHQLHRHRRRLLGGRVRGDRRQGARRRSIARGSCSRPRCTHRWATTRTRRGNSRRWIIEECENSLRRLGTDYIDLYQIHRPDEAVDIDQTLGALSDLVHAGQDPRVRELDVPRRADRRGAVGRRAAGPRALHDRAAAVLDPRARHRARRAPRRAGVRHGRDPVEPTRGRVAVGSVRRGQGQHEPACEPDPCSLRPVDPGEPAQARDRHRARRASPRTRASR